MKLPMPKRKQRPAQAKPAAGAMRMGSGMPPRLSMLKNLKAALMNRKSHK